MCLNLWYYDRQSTDKTLGTVAFLSCNLWILTHFPNTICGLLFWALSFVTFYLASVEYTFFWHDQALGTELDGGQGFDKDVYTAGTLESVGVGSCDCLLADDEGCWVHQCLPRLWCSSNSFLIYYIFICPIRILISLVSLQWPSVVVCEYFISQFRTHLVL